MVTLLGFDAELFLTREGKAAAPHVLLNTKDRPFTVMVPSLNTRNFWYRDGFLCEVNTSCGFWCRGHALMTLQAGLKAMLDRARNEGYALCTSAAMSIPPRAGTEPPDVYELGCVPSQNAYDEPFQLASMDPDKVEFRTAGCHLHVSNRAFTAVNSPETLIQRFDKYIGLPLAYLTQNRAPEAKRRTLYGRAGEFRLPKYSNGSNGVEYRVPSAFIVSYAPLLSLAFGVLRSLFEQHHLTPYPPLSSAESSEVRAMINEGEVPEKNLPQYERWLCPSTLVKTAQWLRKKQPTLDNWYSLPVNAHDFGWDYFKAVTLEGRN